jgi:hypothetical protein
VVDFLEDGEGIVAFALKNHENGNIELDYVFSLRIVATAFPLVLASNYIVEFLEAVERGLLTAVGHVLADAEIGLVGVDVGGIGCQRAE